METQCFIHSKEFIPLLDGVKVSPLMKIKSTEPIPTPVLGSNLPLVDELTVSDTLYCSFCVTGFVDKFQQRAHYKLDWHRYNLKQHLAQKKAISEEKFAQLADDVSSISGSESDSETDTTLTDTESSKEDARLTHLIARRSRILFNNSTGQVISIHRALLLNKKEEAASDEHLVRLLNKLPSSTNWLIIMLGGGHFAAAIFKGNEPILHKTFHSYTVRAKQGGTQSTKDGKGSHGKSAGSSLRNYNEQSLTQHIQSLMKSWAPDIVKCDKIFYRGVGRSNIGILFSGSHPPLIRGDPRLRTIPFHTRRATFNEVKRVHSLLATAFIYDSNEMFRTTFSPAVKETPEAEKKWCKNAESSPKSSPRKIDRAKERPSPVRELPDYIRQLAASTDNSSSECGFQIRNKVEQNVSDAQNLITKNWGGSGINNDLVLVEEEMAFADSLQEFEDTVPQHIKDCFNKKNRRKKKVVKEQNEEKEPLKPEVEKLWKDIHSSCFNGCYEDLQKLLSNRNGISDEEVAMIINQKNMLGETLLHNMASQAKCDTLRLLLMHGADPTIKDKKSQTPYDHSQDKDTRNIFRRFMGQFPDKFDYSKSHIPNPLTEELEAEIIEKRKLARKAKRQKDKERRAAAETMKKEDYEKKCFLNLSDREKRALAAERRILASGYGSVAKSRCYECAADITGKVPFEYNSNRFCTMDCLKKHRSKSKTEKL